MYMGIIIHCVEIDVTQLQLQQTFQAITLSNCAMDITTTQYTPHIGHKKNTMNQMYYLTETHKNTTLLL